MPLRRAEQLGDGRWRVFQRGGLLVDRGRDGVDHDERHDAIRQ